MVLPVLNALKTVLGELSSEARQVRTPHSIVRRYTSRPALPRSPRLLLVWKNNRHPHLLVAERVVLREERAVVKLLREEL
eukprot:COSAG02_NODE_736_length_17865_cov_9.190420_16_plen_80_part_00